MSSRRQFLAALSTGLAASGAGCTDLSGGGTGGTTTDTGSDDTTTATTSTTETTTQGGTETTTTTTATTTPVQMEYDIDGVYPTYMGTPGRTGELDPEGHPRRSPTKEWEAFLDEPREGPFTPVLAGNKLYAAGGYNLARINPTSGKREWQHEFDTHVTSPATVGGGRVYVASRNGIHAIDTETGDQQWNARNVQTYHGRVTPPMWVDGTLYVVNESVLYAVDDESGEVLWTGGPKGAPGEVAIGAGKAFVGSSRGNGGIEAFSLDGGDELWAEGLASVEAIYPRYMDRSVYSCAKRAQQTPQVFAFTHEGDLRWKRTLKGGLEDSHVTAMAVTDGHVLAGDTAGNLHSLAPEDGSQNWRNTLGGGKYYQLTVAGDRIYGINDTRFLVTIDTESGRTIRQFELPRGVYHPPVVHQEAIYVANKRYCYAFS